MGSLAQHVLFFPKPSFSSAAAAYATRLGPKRSALHEMLGDMGLEEEYGDLYSSFPSSSTPLSARTRTGSAPSCLATIFSSQQAGWPPLKDPAREIAYGET